MELGVLLIDGKAEETSVFRVSTDGFLCMNPRPI